MKVTIELSEDASDAAVSMLRAQDMLSVLWDIDQRCRDEMKHGDGNLESMSRTIEDVRTLIYESGLMKEYV